MAERSRGGLGGPSLSPHLGAAWVLPSLPPGQLQLEIK